MRSCQVQPGWQATSGNRVHAGKAARRPGIPSIFTTVAEILMHILTHLWVLGIYEPCIALQGQQHNRNNQQTGLQHHSVVEMVTVGVKQLRLPRRNAKTSFDGMDRTKTKPSTDRVRMLYRVYTWAYTALNPGKLCE